MVTTSEIILAIVIVVLSVVMPIYYYQRKKNPKQDNKTQDNPEIKNYIDRINEITRKKHK